VERGDDDHPIVGVIYCAGNIARRVTFAFSGEASRPKSSVKQVWQAKLGDHHEPTACGRIQDVIIVARPGGGLQAVGTDSGDVHWEVAYEADLASAPLALPGGDVLAMFDDDRWIRIDPANGRRTDEGEYQGEETPRWLTDCQYLEGSPRSIQSSNQLSIDGVALPDDWCGSIELEDVEVTALARVDDFVVVHLGGEAIVVDVGESPPGKAAHPVLRVLASGQVTGFDDSGAPTWRSRL
jgi:hypothetical protein